MLKLVSLLLLAATAQGQDVHGYVAARQKEILAEFTALLAIPNVASDKPNIARNADFILKALAKRGIQGRLLEVPNAPPVIYAEMNPANAEGTVTFYAHYDGQPVEARQMDRPAVPTSFSR